MFLVHFYWSWVSGWYNKRYFPKEILPTLWLGTQKKRSRTNLVSPYNWVGLWKLPFTSSKGLVETLLGALTLKCHSWTKLKLLDVALGPLSWSVYDSYLRVRPKYYQVLSSSKGQVYNLSWYVYLWCIKMLFWFNQSANWHNWRLTVL